MYKPFIPILKDFMSTSSTKGRSLSESIPVAEAIRQAALVPTAAVKPAVAVVASKRSTKKVAPVSPAIKPAPSVSRTSTARVATQKPAAKKSAVKVAPAKKVVLQVAKPVPVPVPAPKRLVTKAVVTKPVITRAVAVKAPVVRKPVLSKISAPVKPPVKAAVKPAIKAAVKPALKKLVVAKAPARATPPVPTTAKPKLDKPTLAGVATQAATKSVGTVSPKAKLVRDSFTMPQKDFALIAILKDRALGFKRPTKKSELLRAGLHALAVLNASALRTALESLTPLPTGRPKNAVR